MFCYIAVINFWNGKDNKKTVCCFALEKKTLGLVIYRQIKRGCRLMGTLLGMLGRE